MGGLLAADAATDASNSGPPTSRRILGVVAFDVPYLGMHPHVVISGIASLFPDDDGDKRTAGDMNQHSDVQIVDDQVTDDWDGFKRNLDGALTCLLQRDDHNVCLQPTAHPIPAHIPQPRLARWQNPPL